MREVKMEDFLPKLQEMHPDLDEKQISKIINQGCHNIAAELKNKRDVMIFSGYKKVKFLIYKYRSYYSEKKKNEKRQEA